MNKQKKINLIESNLSNFSNLDKRERCKLTSNVHQDLFNFCKRNKEVFHIADRLGILTDRINYLSLTPRSFETAKKLNLL